MAKYVEGCCRVCQKVRSVSKVRIEHPSTRRDPQPDLQPMAFCTMGARYCGPLPRSHREQEVCDNGDRQFHQVGGGRSFGEHHDVNAKKFFWKNIVTQFGIPEALISDNRLQFHRNAFKKYCGNLRIKNRYSTSVYYC